MLLSLSGRPDRDTAKAVIRRAAQVGMTLIDTANVYAKDDRDLGHNERLIAEALGEVFGGPSWQDRVVVASKGGRTRSGEGWGHDARPKALVDACHASLRALSMERIPLYHLHSPDPDVPFEASVETLARLREEGKIGSVGLSNVTIAQLRTAASIVPIGSVQNQLSVWDIGYRSPPVLKYCAEKGIPFLAYAPLGGRTRASALGSSSMIQGIADRLDATPQELALAWLSAWEPVIVPIPGATRCESVDSSARAATIRLDARTSRALTRAFRRLPGARGIPARILGKLRGVFGR